MNGYLLDTNVISELRKGNRADANVRNWAGGLQPSELYISVITLAEIRKGIATVRSRDPQQASNLESWRTRLETEYDSRGKLLPVDAHVARAWGDLHAIRQISVLDGFLAATALVHSLTVATRNLADFQGLGVLVVDPFA